MQTSRLRNISLINYHANGEHKTNTKLCQERVQTDKTEERKHRQTQEDTTYRQTEGNECNRGKCYVKDTQQTFNVHSRIHFIKILKMLSRTTILHSIFTITYPLLQSHIHYTQLLYPRVPELPEVMPIYVLILITSWSWASISAGWSGGRV